MRRQTRFSTRSVWRAARSANQAREVLARGAAARLEPLRVVPAVRADDGLAERLVAAGAVDPGGEAERLLVGVGVARPERRLPESIRSSPEPGVYQTLMYSGSGPIRQDRPRFSRAMSSP